MASQNKGGSSLPFLFALLLGLCLCWISADVGLTDGFNSFCPGVDAIEEALQGTAMVPDGFNPWNPGARCVHISEITDMYPVCPGYLTYEWIYVDIYHSNRTLKIAERSRVSVSRNTCLIRQAQIYCSATYRPCEWVDVPGWGRVAVARELCYDFCEARTNSCIPIYEAYPGLTRPEIDILLSCETPYPFDFGMPYTPLFPVWDGNYTSTVRIWNETNSTNIFEFDVTFPCYNDNKNISAGYAAQYCPLGTYNVDSQTCAFNCPEPLIEDSEYDAATVMLSVVSWFSFILTAFLVVSFMLDFKKKLSYPSSLSFFFIVCIMCISWALCLASMVGHQDMWCEDNDTPNRWGDGWCVTQGVTYAYFTLAGALWWFLIGLALFASVAFNFKPQHHVVYNVSRLKFAITGAHVLQLVFHTLCWGIPLGIVIIALGNHKIGYGGADFWCTIHSNEMAVFVNGVEGVVVSGVSDIEEADAWNLTLLTLPVLLLMLMGTIVLGLVVLFAWIKSKEGWRFFWHQWRLLALMCLYIWTYSFIFSHRIAFTAQRHNQFDEYAQNILCLRQHFDVDKNDASDVCPIHSQVNFPLWFIAAFNTAIQGVLVFLIYGSSRAPYKAWARIFRRIIPPSSSSSNPTAKRSLVVIVGQKIREASSRALSQAYEGDDEEGNDNDDSGSDDQSEQEDRSSDPDSSMSPRKGKEMTIDELTTSDESNEEDEEDATEMDVLDTLSE